MKKVMIILLVALASTFIFTPAFAEPPALAGVVSRSDNIAWWLYVDFDSGLVAIQGYDALLACANPGAWWLWDWNVWQFQEIATPADVGLWKVKGDDVHTAIYPETVIVLNPDGTINPWATGANMCSGLPEYALIAKGTADVIFTDNYTNFDSDGNDNKRGKTQGLSAHGLVYSPDDVDMEDPMRFSGGIQGVFNDDGERIHVHINVKLLD